MSSSFSKQYGDIYIFGEYPNSDKVDLVFSNATEEFTVEEIKRSHAENLIRVWNDMQSAAEELQEKAWMYDELQ